MPAALRQFVAVAIGEPYELRREFAVPGFGQGEADRKPFVCDALHISRETAKLQGVDDDAVAVARLDGGRDDHLAGRRLNEAAGVLPSSGQHEARVEIDIDHRPVNAIAKNIRAKSCFQ